MDCRSNSFLKLSRPFIAGAQRFVRVKGFKNKFCEVTRLEFTASENKNEILSRPDADALATAPHSFEHARIVLAFHPPQVAEVVAVRGAVDMSARGCPNPSLRQNLALAPAPALKKQLPKLRHIAGAQLK